MDPKYVNMNHGSYGAVPKTVTAALQAAQASVEFCPDAFFRYEMFHQLDDGESERFSVISSSLRSR